MQKCMHADVLAQGDHLELHHLLHIEQPCVLDTAAAPLRRCSSRHVPRSSSRRLQAMCARPRSSSCRRVPPARCFAGGRRRHERSDSAAVVAAIAVDALGAENVVGVLMPSRYSSEHSVSDAEHLAANLGIETFTVPIEPAHAAFTGMLAPNLADQRIETGDLTDQNLQSRIRGVILMAMANEHGWLVLTTGNKSEAAVGYSTLYGDTAGAFAVIRDVWKLTVYDLCAWRNTAAAQALIPANVLTKPPSAELKPGQRDDQSLPDYEILDPILRAYVEDDKTVAEILAMELDGADPETVQRVCRLVDIAEFKRRQTPLGTRITAKAFGRDRRIPIINRYRG